MNNKNYPSKPATALKSVFLFLILTALMGNVGWGQASSYTFSASSGTYSPLSSGAINTSLTATVDDGISSAITLPFAFNFAGTNYTQCYLSSNGWISFTYNTDALYNNSSANAQTAKPVIFPLWDDLQNTVIPRYRTDGAAPNRIFKITIVR